ncbi:HNH endonuclease [Candidatus Poribacteria bacterium]|nr:HNH endonuclease [Candidatus Poribacteria bacterium]
MQSAISVLQKYIQKMENLRVDRAHGAAPHKPILLLSVIELIEQGQIHENQIFISPSLAETFMKYWTKATDRSPNIALPFFHLISDGFWHLHVNTGYERALETARSIRAISRLREVVAYASLDDDLFLLLTDAHHREVIRQTLIRVYFPELKEEIESVIAEDREIGEYRQLLIQEVAYPFSAQKPSEPSQAEMPIRRAGFRQAIMGLYDYTCAVCRLRIVTMDGESATDAAHIIPFRISHNDDVRNGISLCKLHHWTFDIGLISLSEIYQVVVSPLLSDRRPTEWMLTELRNKSVLLPEHEQLHPAQDALAWHRKEIFRR